MTKNINVFDTLFSGLTQTDIKKCDLIFDVTKAICTARQAEGMSQTKFAQFMGVSQGMVSKWESFNYNFTLDNIANIFDKLALDVSIVIHKKEYINECKFLNITITEHNINEELGFAS